MRSLEQPEVAVIGGGVGGGALATVLAREGVAAAVLERDLRAVDRVRGEVLAHWGVAEASRLGLLSILEAAGGRHATRIIEYDEIVPPKEAEARAIDARASHPIGLGPLCMGHPLICETLCKAAADAGATILRGIRDIEVEPGEPPRLRFSRDDQTFEWRPRLIVGADGRNSVIRRQLGFEVSKDQPHHLTAGMLVDAVSDWPQDLLSLGTEDNIHFLVFPQGNAKLRLYVCYGFDDRHRFAGLNREQNFLSAFRLRCLPYGESIAAGKPAGPLHSYSNEDHWVEQPTAPGLVLIGDAAGHNDPITGQGTALALRDVRALAEIIRGGDWGELAFRPYVEERLERMRRMRIAARFVSKMRAEFGSAAAARRAAALNRIFVEGALSPYLSVFVGPESVPAEAFEDRTIENLLPPL